jgi:hypothetical protein
MGGMPLKIEQSCIKYLLTHLEYSFIDVYPYVSSLAEELITHATLNHEINGNTVKMW